MSYIDFATAFVDQAVLDAAKAIKQKFDKFHWPVEPCQTALQLLQGGQAGDSYLFDALAIGTGLEPQTLYFSFTSGLRL